MPLEIERRFLVRPRLLRLRGGTDILQAYFAMRGATGRIRITSRAAYLTVKSPARGIVRRELEHPIPADLAAALLDSLCLPGRITKTRHRIRYGGRLWEVDVFGGANRGLVLAEVELDRADAAVIIPPWAAREVSTDRRFTNSRLARNPFRTWSRHRQDDVRAAMRSPPAVPP